MSKSSRNKGYGGEREVARLLADAGLTEAVRMPLSGALPDFPGDVRLEGYCVEVKRTEKASVWAWIEQAAAAARGGRVPLVCFRRNRSQWYTLIPTIDFAAMEAELREWREWGKKRTLYEEAK